MQAVLDDLLIDIFFTPHAQGRMAERGVDEEDILSCILAAGESLLDVPNKRILIRDKDFDKAIICKFNYDNGLSLSIITVLDNGNKNTDRDVVKMTV